MRLASPHWLILLVLAPLPWLVAHYRPRLRWPSLDGFPSRGWRRWAAQVGSLLPGGLQGLAIACLVVALARPTSVAGRSRIAGQGVAIVVAL
ncbi:MAG: BatA domain-containing protein, partial [Isosphaeraceae bacterium]